MNTQRIFSALIVLVLLASNSIAQNYPKAGSSKTESSQSTVSAFISKAKAGDQSGAVALCEYEIGNGKTFVPAEQQVKKFVGFLRARTLKKVSSRPTGLEKVVQYKYKSKEDDRLVIINVKPIGKKWVITAVNI